ncbi:MAG: hypothetical protein R2754_12360 [Microthrixaceae bacterium]
MGDWATVWRRPVRSGLGPRSGSSSDDAATPSAGEASSDDAVGGVDVGVAGDGVVGDGDAAVVGDAGVVGAVETGVAAAGIGFGAASVTIPTTAAPVSGTPTRPAALMRPMARNARGGRLVVVRGVGEGWRSGMAGLRGAGGFERVGWM